MVEKGKPMVKGHCTWAGFYSRLADKLLTFKDDRRSLTNKLLSLYEGVDMKLPKLDSLSTLIRSSDSSTKASRIPIEKRSSQLSRKLSKSKRTSLKISKVFLRSIISTRRSTPLRGMDGVGSTTSTIYGEPSKPRLSLLRKTVSSIALSSSRRTTRLSDSSVWGGSLPWACIGFDRTPSSASTLVIAGIWVT